MSSVRPSNSGCTRIMEEHEGSVRNARGEAESISSCLRALPTIRVHPVLDGRTLDIVHCFYNIARHFMLKTRFFCSDQIANSACALAGVVFTGNTFALSIFRRFRFFCIDKP